MRQRLTMILAALTGVGLITGVAWAAMPPAALTVVDERTVAVADAGEVTFLVEDAALTVVEIHTSAGWVSETEVASGPQIEVDFRRGDRRVRFDAELEGGEVRVDIRQEGGTETTVATGPATSGTAGTSTSAVASTPTTVGGTSSTAPGTTPSSSSTTVGDTTSTSTGSSTSSTTDASTPSTTVPDSTSTTGATTSTTIDDRTSTTHGEPELAAGSETYQIPGVATVAIAWADGRLTLVSYTAASGWVAEIEDQRPDRIRIDFESDDDDARFEARLDGQDLRVEARKD
jgi:hypothetical protein